MKKKGWGRAPGSAGELVQGQTMDGQDFLVSLPIALESHVHILLDESISGLAVDPVAKSKTRQAVEIFLGRHGLKDVGGKITIHSAIPVGKGMASSTADMAAACRAAGNALNLPATPEVIAAVAQHVEPTDGIMYPGLVSFDHRRCALIESLGDIPPMDILLIDLGGTVDTLTFNQQAKNYTPQELQHIQQAYQLLKAGITARDLRMIGEAGIISARVNQRLLHKPALETIIQFALKQGASGICIAHSGTVVSILFEPGRLLLGSKQILAECHQANLDVVFVQVEGKKD